MRKLYILVFAFVCLSMTDSTRAATFTENFDVAGNWGGGTAGSYNTKTYVNSGEPVTFDGLLSIRQNSGTQDGFASTHSGSYSWRIRNATGTEWSATIATGGVGTFSVWVRRWDSSPGVDFSCEYSIDNGGSWTLVQNITNTWLGNTSDWSQINGTINTSNGAGTTDDIIIRIRRNSGERLMIDDFEMTDFTPCPAPTTQATAVLSSAITQTTASIDWTDGNGNARAVFIRQANTGTVSPVDDTTYTANTVFASGEEIGSTGWYCIFNDSANATISLTGLTASTDYIVMVTEYNCVPGAEQYITTTGTGNPHTFTTLASTSPAIVVSTASLTAFGNLCINTNSTTQSYTVSGINLLNDIVVTAPTGYEIKAIGTGTWGTSVTLSPITGTVGDTTVNVRFSPTATGTIAGDIMHTSTLATTQNVAVTGVGINTPGSVTTTVASVITTTTASSGGTSTLGCNNITARGVVFDTSPSPTINATSDGTGAGSYTSSLAGLTSNTTYYYRSYIVDATGTIYGNELNFTTLKDEPTNHPTAFACGTTTTSTIPLTWTDATSATTPDNYLIKWSIISFASITDPVDGTFEADGANRLNVSQGVGTATASGLTTNATYYFKIYPYTNTGTNVNYKTSATIAQTTCMTQNGPCVDEDFVSFTDWTDNGTSIDNIATHAGAAIPCRAMGSGDNMISPAVNNPNLLEFFQDASSGGSGNTATVEYRIGAGAWTACHSFVVTTAGNTESVDLTNISGVNLAVQTNVSFRFNSTFSTWYLDDVEITCGTPDAEINVSGNGVAILDGDLVASVADDTEFGNVAVVGGFSTHSFIIENTGGLDLTLSGSPTVSLTDGTHFTVSTQPSATTLSNGDSTTFVVTFDPTSTGVKIDTIKIENDDADEDPYNFVIRGTGTNSNASDIVTDATFTYTTNIPYLSFQNAGPFTNTIGSVGVFRFDIRDGGSTADSDALGTELTDITFSVGTTHINYIRNAALFDGNAMRANAPTINTVAGTITFSGLSGANFTAADDGSLRLTLRVSFVTNVTDNEKLVFSVTSATANPTNSAFAVGNAGGAFSDNGAGNNRNRIEVTATALAFGQQPGNAAINTTMAPAVTVNGIDVNSNIDLDFTDNVDISSSGTMTGDPITATAAGGTSSYAGIVHTVAGTGYVLTASHATFADATSSLFDITTIVFVNGDYRTTGNSTWLSGGVAPWESFTAGAWSASTAPTYSTSNTVYIRNGHTVTTGGSFGNNINIVVQDGGRFNTNHPGTSNSILVNDGGTFAINASLTNNNNFEVEDNGTVIINRRYGNGTENIPSWWDGTEIFHPNSTIIFNDYDCADDYLIPDNTSIDANTYSGYTAVFGNIIIDYGANLGSSDDWKMLDAGVTVNMAHGDLIFRSNDNSGATMRLATTGTVTSGLGGDFYVENGYNNTGSINMKTSGNLTFTIEGNMQLDAATTRIMASAIGTSMVNIEGDLNITPSAVLNFNSTASATPIAILNLKGDVTVAGSGLLTNNNSFNHGEFNFVGTGDGLTPATTQTIDIASTSSQENRYISFNAEAGTYVQQINRDFELGTNSSLSIKFDATYDFGFNVTTPLNLTISGTQTGTSFSSRLGSTLKITNPDGIWGGGAQPTAQGNVQTVKSNRSYNQVATFHYIGKTNQVTGNGITTGASGKQIICELIDNNTQLSFTNSTGITSATTISSTGGKLDIRIGQVIESTSAYIDGSDGTLYMGLGTLYQIAKGNTTAALSNVDPIPRISGTVAFPYILTGGTVELIGNTVGNRFQTLRGSQFRPNFINVKFSGTNTLGTDYKNLTSTTVIENELIVTDNVVVDCINSAGLATSFIGDGALVMDNGRIRIKKLNTPNPELTGIDADYNITGGTVEFYGTNGTESQLLRGTDSRTTPRTISYFNIELNADFVNSNLNADPSQNYNVGLAAGIEVEGIMNVNNPTVFQTDRFDHIDGGGVFNVQPGATYKYGDDYGITLGTSTTESAGAIRVTSNRTIANFPSTASYGFVGASNMVTGNGLPAEIVNCYLQKSINDTFVVLTNNLTINNTFNMQRGNLVAVGPQVIELGISTAQIGTLNYDDTDEPFVIGRMKRWFNTATNSGYESSLFPFGDTTGTSGTDIYNRFAQIEYTSVKSSGGSLSGYFRPIPMGYAGIPINGIIADGGCPTFDVVHTEDQGFWKIDDADGLAGGDYNITCTGEGFENITNMCQITLIKRVNGSNWFENGTHVAAFYLNGNVAKPTTRRLNASGWSNYGFGGGIDVLLPITLTSFTAENIDNNSLLNWSTSSEINNDYFEIEHSLDASTFTTIGEKDGNGTTNEDHFYNFTHYSPPVGINYYRLKQVDFDETESFSQIRSVEIEGEDNTMTVVNTLPQNELTLQFQSQNAKKGNLVIYAANGQVIKKQSLELDEGSTLITIDVSNLPSAMYIVQWYNGEEIIEEKFIKKY